MNLTTQYSVRDFESIWSKDGVWHMSEFARRILAKAQRQYPATPDRGKAAWPSDEKSIGQNLRYLFPGHFMKMDKVFCRVLTDESSLRFLEDTNSFSIVDLACGPGMASIAVVDFLLQMLKKKRFIRRAPLTLHFLLNDLKPACVEAAKRNLHLVRDELPHWNASLSVGTVQTAPGSVSTILPVLRDFSCTGFEILCFCNAFDHVLIYGEQALEDDPHCSDPIAQAKPCDRQQAQSK